MVRTPSLPFQEHSLTNQSAGTGFRYTKVMAWGPAVILAFALVAMAMEQVVVGLLLAVMAILFWVIVRRRKNQSAPK